MMMPTMTAVMTIETRKAVTRCRSPGDRSSGARGAVGTGACETAHILPRQRPVRVVVSAGLARPFLPLHIEAACEFCRAVQAMAHRARTRAALVENLVVQGCGRLQSRP